jgi:hypothetical protein
MRGWLSAYRSHSLHTYIHACMYACIYIYTYIYIYAFISLCLCVVDCLLTGVIPCRFLSVKDAPDSHKSITIFWAPCTSKLFNTWHAHVYAWIHTYMYNIHTYIHTYIYIYIYIYHAFARSRFTHQHHNFENHPQKSTCCIKVHTKRAHVPEHIWFIRDS